jgi:hypothetical protein
MWKKEKNWSLFGIERATTYLLIRPVIIIKLFLKEEGLVVISLGDGTDTMG